MRGEIGQGYETYPAYLAQHIVYWHNAWDELAREEEEEQTTRRGGRRSRVPRAGYEWSVDPAPEPMLTARGGAIPTTYGGGISTGLVSVGDDLTTITTTERVSLSSGAMSRHANSIFQERPAAHNIIVSEDGSLTNAPAEVDITTTSGAAIRRGLDGNGNYQDMPCSVCWETENHLRGEVGHDYQPTHRWLNHRSRVMFVDEISDTRQGMRNAAAYCPLCAHMGLWVGVDNMALHDCQVPQRNIGTAGRSIFVYEWPHNSETTAYCGDCLWTGVADLAEVHICSKRSGAMARVICGECHRPATGHTNDHSFRWGGTVEDQLAECETCSFSGPFRSVREHICTMQQGPVAVTER